MNSWTKRCISCSKEGVVNTAVYDNQLKCTCSACGHRRGFPLLKLQKKIIYLDQNFFSHWHNDQRNKKTTKFTEIGKKLTMLAKKQLVICPYSDVHDKETHLGQIDGLWDFIRSVSRGKKFLYQKKVLENQLIKAYNSFLRNNPPQYQMDLRDVIEPNVHDWDQSLRIDMNFSLTQIIPKNSLDDFKPRFAGLIIKELPQWRSSKASLKHIYALEIRDHALILRERFREVFSSMDFMTMCNSEEFNIICTLLSLKTDNEQNKFTETRLDSFLFSDHFKHVPSIDISSGLWAILKEKIKQQQFLTEKTRNVEEKVRGIPFDIEHLSVFAPYCDAIFTENKMAEWLKEAFSKCCVGNYAFKVFSATSSDDFIDYLDEINNGMTSEMERELQFAYRDLG